MQFQISDWVNDNHRGNNIMKTTAIVLAAGSGKRMNSKVHKQYLLIDEKPVLYYALKAFEESAVDEIVLVVGAGEIEFCRGEIVDKFGIGKVKAIIEGGKERYHSVYEGLKEAAGTDYVLIHDGARPFLTQEIIERTLEAVMKYQACVVGMPVKDTVKIVDEDTFAKETPNRSMVWQVQTPQAFAYNVVYDAYTKMFEIDESGITDDAMVVERMTEYKVKLIEGSYRNIKITTPEDLLVAEAYLKK